MYHKLNLKDFKITNPRKTLKATSRINEKGDLIIYKDYEVPELTTSISSSDTERKKKKNKSKAKRKKGCGCKS